MPFNRAALFRTFLLLFLLPVSFRGHAQEFHWNGPEQYDTGVQPSVAIHSSGLVVEFAIKARTPAAFGIASVEHTLTTSSGAGAAKPGGWAFIPRLRSQKKAT